MSGVSTMMNGQRTKATGNWTGEWSALRNVNTFLMNWEKCKSPYSDFKQYVGEAYFFRAMFYFDKVKKYGDVPLYDKVIEMDDTESLMRPRDPRTMVIDHVLADLDEALKHLELRSSVGNNRINKECALAFKTRVALYEGSWQKYHAGTDYATPGADPKKYFKI